MYSLSIAFGSTCGAIPRCRTCTIAILLPTHLLALPAIMPGRKSRYSATFAIFVQPRRLRFDSVARIPPAPQQALPPSNLIISSPSHHAGFDCELEILPSWYVELSPSPGKMEPLSLSVSPRTNLLYRGHRALEHWLPSGSLLLNCSNIRHFLFVK